MQQCWLTITNQQCGHLHDPQYVSIYLGWRWGRGSFRSSPVFILYLVWRWGGAHLDHPQYVILYLVWWWGRGSFTSSTVCLPLPLCGGGGGAQLHRPQCVSLYLVWRWGRGSFASSKLCLPLSWVVMQMKPSLYLGWEGLIITHGMSPSTLNGNGGGAHLHRPQCVSLYLGWWWGRGLICIVYIMLPSIKGGYGGGSFASSTVVCALPLV